MTDILERLRTNVCPENHGCGVMPYCACASAADAADEIARLRAEKAELVEALDDMASQKLWDEMTDDEQEAGSFVDAYDIMVKVARRVLTKARAQSEPHDSEGETG